MRNDIKDNKHYFIIISSVCFLLCVFELNTTLYAAGEIVAWGTGQPGHSGVYDYGQCLVPSPNTDFNSIAAGYYHSLGIKRDGSIVAWGRNASGECNVPSPNTGFVAIAAGYGHSLGLKQDGSVVCWGTNLYHRGGPEPNTGFIAIAAGESYSLGLKQDGSIVAWGDQTFGECNVPEPNMGFVAIAAGAYHSLGLKQDGSIVAWGYNDNGECNVPSPNTGFVAIAAGWWHSLGLKKDGSIVVWGLNISDQFNVPEPNTGFVAIAAGCGHSLGLKQDGSIVAWGDNQHGELNVPLPNTSFVAVAVGGEHSLGLKSNIVIARCKVTAGKTQEQDAFSVSGTVAFPADLDFNDVNHIDVNIISLTDGVSIYTETVDSGVVKGKFKYTYKIPRGGTGAITSLAVDFNRKLFSIKAQKVNLTGLSCPLQLELTMSGPITGDYKLSGNADEFKVNGTKELIPTRLVRTYKDILVVDKSKARHNSTKASSDTLSVTGDIAVIDTDVNLCNVDVNFVWGQQLFSIPPKSFKAYRTGHLFKCRKVAADANGNTGIVTALVDTDKATFKLSVNGVNAIDSASASIPFGISFADFNETVDVNRVTGRSW